MQEIRSKLTVTGAGPAGITAALAAARQGIDTVLICERPVLGGNSSSEIRVWTRGAVGAGNLFAEEMGIWGELKLQNLYRNPDANPIFWDEVLLDAALHEKNLRLFLNTAVSDVSMAGMRIAFLDGIQLGTEKKLRFMSDLYIDATGDGLIASRAGMQYETGSGEGTLGSSILYYTRKEDHPVAFIAPDYAYPMAEIEKLVDHGGRIINERMSGCDCWWFEYGGMKDTIADEQSITIELKRLVLGVWNYIKNSGKFKADNYTLEWIGNIAGKRESRRMQTRTILRESDIESGRQFPDGGFYGGWYIDSHPPGGIEDTDAENCIQKPVHVYQIPLSCLYGEQKNLIVAGRMIGTDSNAFYSSRVMNTCALSGQAAGTLSAVCLKEQISVPQISGKAERVQNALAREDVFIPGRVSPDPEDEALSAQASASSVESSEMLAATDRMPLGDGGFAVFPGRKGTVRIWFESSEQKTVVCHLHADMLPNRYLAGKPDASFEWRLKKGISHQDLEVPETAWGKFAVLTFEPASQASLQCCRKSRTGFLCGTREKSEYREPLIQYLSAEEHQIYAPEKAVDGADRPWGEPHAWIPAADDSSPWLQLEWKEAAEIKELRIYLEPDLSMELVNSRAQHWALNHHYTRREGMPPQLLRRFTVAAYGDDGARTVLAQVEDNARRMVVIPVRQGSRIRKMRLEEMETWGKASPVIYEIRAYASGIKE